MRTTSSRSDPSNSDTSRCARTQPH